MKNYLNSDKFDLVSNLTTINVIKLQNNTWKILENGKYSGEKSDDEVVKMVEKLAKEEFEVIIPELNY